MTTVDDHDVIGKSLSFLEGVGGHDDGAAGVPGALTNQPPAGGTVVAAAPYNKAA